MGCKGKVFKAKGKSRPDKVLEADPALTVCQARRTGIGFVRRALPGGTRGLRAVKVN